MSLRQYLAIMTGATIISWLIWLTVILFFDPNAAGFLGFAFFYVSLFLSLLGTFTLVGFIIRAKIIKNEDAVFRHMKKNFRQGFIFSVFCIIVLILAQIKLLTWWNFALLVTLYAFTEGLIFTNRKYQNQDYVK
ncbi:MAG: hypothetical protein WC457_01110 [Patescibacteria group bacterium]